MWPCKMNGGVSHVLPGGLDEDIGMSQYSPSNSPNPRSDSARLSGLPEERDANGVDVTPSPPQLSPLDRGCELVGAPRANARTGLVVGVVIATLSIGLAVLEGVFVIVCVYVCMCVCVCVCVCVCMCVCVRGVVYALVCARRFLKVL